MGLVGRHRRLAGRLTFCISAFLPTESQAAEPAPNNPADGGEIVVTARRREEDIQRVPIAVTAFSRGDIAARNATDLAQAAEFAPNISFDSTAPISGSANAASLFIRGVGQTDFTISSDAGVAVYVDGVNLSRTIGSVVDLFDVERVELLRGPQGTLFGRNAVGGAITVTRTTPQLSLSSAEGELIVGSFDRRDLTAVANLPLGSSMAVRLGGVRRQRDGFARRILVGDTLGAVDNYALRGAVKWQPHPSLELVVSADYTKADEEPLPSALRSGSRTATFGAPQTIFAGRLYNNLIVDSSGTAPCQRPDFIASFCGLPGLIELPVLPAGTLPWDERWLTGDPRRTFATGRWQSAHEVKAVTANARLNLGEIELRSITGYRNLNAAFDRDVDGSPLAIIGTSNRIRHEQFSQEFQLGGSGKRVTWLAGLYLLSENGSDAAVAPFVEETFATLRRLSLGCTLYPAVTGAPVPIQVPVCPNIFYIGYLDDGVTTAARSLALFGEASLKLTGNVTVTAGARWTRDSKRIDISDFTVGGVPVATSPRASQHWQQLTPRVIVDWRVDSAKLLYASWSSGYKAGGFNQRYGAPIAAPTSFSPERVRSLEAGFKSDFLGGRARLNAALFTAGYSDIQVVVFDSGIPRTINAAKGRISGFELEARLRPLDGLQLDLSYGWLNARYTRLDPAIIGSFGTPIVNPLRLGYRFVNSPRHSLAVGASYRHQLPGGDTLTARADLIHKSQVANDAVNTPELMQPPVTIINARLAYASRDGRWTAALFGTNLTNRQYVTSGVADEPGFGAVEINVARPRELGLSVALRL